MKGTYDEAQARPRVVLAEDHSVVAEGLARVLSGAVRVVSVVHNGEALIDAVRRYAPDVVISDVSMPSLSGVEALRRLRSAGDATPFIFLTMYTQTGMAKAAMEAGASGFVAKSSATAELLSAIRVVQSGGRYVSPAVGQQLALAERYELYQLTPRQKDVLNLLAWGLRPKEIAAQLDLSVRTVEAHKYALMQVFSAHSTVELVHRATELGFVV